MNLILQRFCGVMENRRSSMREGADGRVWLMVCGVRMYVRECSCCWFGDAELWS